MRFDITFSYYPCSNEIALSFCAAVRSARSCGAPQQQAAAGEQQRLVVLGQAAAEKAAALSQVCGLLQQLTCTCLRQWLRWQWPSRNGVHVK
jgi:hypothetical protein